MSNTLQTRAPEEVLKKFWSEDGTVLSCSKHLYTGPGSKIPPHFGCKDCAFVTIFSLIARHKGHKGEALDELESIIHAMTELADEGNFDYKSEKLQITKEPLKE